MIGHALAIEGVTAGVASIPGSGITSIPGSGIASIPGSGIDIGTVPGSGIDLLSLGAVVFGVVALLGYSLLSLVVGGLLISNAESALRAIDEQVRTEPLRSGGFGVAAAVAAVGMFLLTGVVVGTLVQAGAPLQVNGLLLLAILAGFLLIVGATAVGNIVAGSVLLRQFTDGAPNLWLALLLGVLGVSLLSLLPVVKLVGPAVTVLALGGGVGWLWEQWDGRPELFEPPS